MSSQSPKVYLVDDDPNLLLALSRLLRASGYEVRSYSSAGAFLADHDLVAPGCLVLDISLPDMDGIALQRELSANGPSRPIVFLTGFGDIPTSVRAMRAGAEDFLQKPVDERDLLDAVRRAVEKDARRRIDAAEINDIRERLNSLTPRERQVLTYVVAGLLNKQIAAELGTVEKTVKVHRARVMQKMNVRSVAELVRLTERAGIEPADHHPSAG